MGDALVTIFEGNQYDLIVIGGGINGAAIARDAALRGLKTVLFEKSDFGEGASSHTSKLAHGGLRYLEHYEFSLVKESLRERDQLIKNAPHLVKPMPFIFPVYKGDRRPLWMIKLGLYLYDFLKGRDDVPSHKNLNFKQIHEIFQHLNTHNLKGGCLYYDAQMDDQRLILENILDAESAGARICNYTPVVGLLKKNGRLTGVQIKNEAEGKIYDVFADEVVNVTGAWSNEVTAMDEKLLGIRVNPVKGIHLVVPQVSATYALALTTPQDQRLFFVIPWGLYSLIGTTETDYSGDPNAVTVTGEDKKYLIEAYNHYFPKKPIEESSIISSFAGLRPLVDLKSSEAYASREHAIVRSPSGLTTMLGGKYTTHRKMAEEVVDGIAARHHKPLGSVTLNRPFPGGKGIVAPPSPMWGLSDEQREHLERCYGSNVQMIYAALYDNAEETRRLCAHHPHIFAEVTYAINVEKARTLSDWYFRRTTIAYSKCKGCDSIEMVAAKFASLLHWDAEKMNREIDNYKAIIQDGEK